MEIDVYTSNFIWESCGTNFFKENRGAPKIRKQSMEIPPRHRRLFDSGSPEGEMGASLVKARVMETVLQYIRNTMNGKFENMKELMKDTIRMKCGNWYKRANSYRVELGLEWEELYNISKEDLKKKIRKWDTDEWEKELSIRSTLKYYKMGKKEIGYENCYRNSRDSIYYARARTNSLKLEEAIGRGNEKYDKTCKLCGEEEENLLHFIIKCPPLENKRIIKL